MTTYQEQPLSRRALREREAEAARAAEATSRPESAGSVPGETPSAEPLSYVTQGRSPLPQYDAPVVRPSEPPVAAQEPPASSADAAVEAADAGFRYRDFSPEGRRAARMARAAETIASADLDYRTASRAEVPTPSAPPVVTAPPAAEVPAVVEAPPVVEVLPVVEVPPVVEVVSLAPAAAAAAPLTRRELRAIREAEEREARASAPVDEAPASAPTFDEVLVGELVEPDEEPPQDRPIVPIGEVRPLPPALVEPVAPQTDAIANLEALFRATTAASPIVPLSLQEEPVLPTPLLPAPVQPIPLQGAPVTETPPQPAAPIALPQEEAPAPPLTFADFSLTLQPPSPLERATVPPPGAAWVSNPPASAASAAPATDSQPPVPGERPRNHWSRQAELDDEAQPATGSLSRDVGVGQATANALVLPEISIPDIIVSPVTSTGDVLVTGSISLPASLSSTGALATQLDESDLDHLLDPGDLQVASTDSQPVRAIRAVSTHTSSREIIGTIKPRRGNRALTALIISAAGMAVVVVTLLVVALASGVLG